jgi:hypothetical protein
MKRYVLPITVMLLSCVAFAQDCSQDESAAFQNTKAAVSALLSYPGYSGSEEKVLNRAGDSAAIAVIRTVSFEDTVSPKRAEQILLILKLAFAAPQLIAASNDRRPTAALLLLDRLKHSSYGQGNNEIENTRIEIEQTTTTGKPLEFVQLPGTPPIDREHTQWIESVLGWTNRVREGMTRKDVEKVFTTEGGISTRAQQTYVLKGCPYIKVEVEFSFPDEGHSLDRNPGDKIIKISKPYLEYSIMD